MYKDFYKEDAEERLATPVLFLFLVSGRFTTPIHLTAGHSPPNGPNSQFEPLILVLLLLGLGFLIF